MIPMTLSYDDATVILCNGSRLTIDKYGNIKVEGSIKDVALGLVKYVVQPEFSEGVITWELNKALRIEQEDGKFYLEYVGPIPKKPPFWSELEKEFHRVAAMKAFW